MSRTKVGYVRGWCSDVVTQIDVGSTKVSGCKCRACGFYPDAKLARGHCPITGRLQDGNSLACVYGRARQ